ncbi:MAG: nucleoside triphosphate pyrophosphohydrolase, partial [Thermoleophilaceae bacterium]
SFLSLLMEERDAGSLAAVAEGCRLKLIRRHPHVFGEREAQTAADVVRNWGQIKRDDERGGEIFGEIAATLPSTLYAKKVLKRAQAAGAPHPDGGQDHGGRLLDAVRAAVEDGADPELELRRAADRYREQVERRDR